MDGTRTDSSGLVLGPRVHDGFLRELHFIDGKTLEFVIVRPDRSVVGVRLEGLLAFGIRDFTQGSIVGWLLAWPIGAVPAYRAECHDGPWNTLLGTSLRPEDVASTIERMVARNPGAQFVQLLCAVGGSVSAICEQLTFEDIRA